jgi:hypothetical protein
MSARRPMAMGLPGGIANPCAAVVPAMDDAHDARLADSRVNFVHPRGLERARDASGRCRPLQNPAPDGRAGRAGTP